MNAYDVYRKDDGTWMIGTGGVANGTDRQRHTYETKENMFAGLRMLIDEDEKDARK